MLSPHPSRRSPVSAPRTARVVLAALFAAGASFVPVRLAEAAPAWRRIGPEGSRVVPLAVAPSAPRVVWAAPTLDRHPAFEPSLYKSTDGGETFTPVPLTGVAVQTVYVDPTNPSLVLAGTRYRGRYEPRVGVRVGGVASRGILKSTDGGATWREANVGWPSNFATGFSFAAQLVPDPTASGAIWARADFDGLCRTTDSGDTWRCAKPRLPDGSSLLLGQLELGNGPSPDLYLAAFADGFVRSTDGGVTFSPSNAGFPTSFGAPPRVGPIAFVPGAAPTLLAWTEGRDLARATALFKSTDRGETWAPAGVGLPTETGGDRLLPVEELVPDRVRLGRVYAVVRTRAGPGPLEMPAIDRALYVSLDAGSTWSLLPPAPDGGSCGSLAPSKLLSSPDGALFGFADRVGPTRSDDGGASFRRLGPPPQKSPLVALALDPVTPGGLVASADGRLVRSDDRGVTWRTAAVSGSCPPPAGALDAVAGRVAIYGLGAERLLRSTDGGATWSLPGGGEFTTPVSLAASPGNGAVVLVSTAGVAAPGAPIREGASRETPASHELSGVFRSTDSGETFARVPSFPPTHAFFSQPIFALTFDGRDPNRVFAGGLAVSRSTNGGATFTPSRIDLAPIPGYPPFGGVTAFGLDPNDPNVVFAGTDGVGIYRSTDGGLTFAPSSAGLPRTRGAGERDFHPVVRALVVDPRDSSRVWAAAFSFDPPRGGTTAPAAGGVFASTDGGRSWASITAGVSGFDENVSELRLETRAGAVLYAATGSGLYALDVPAPFDLTRVTPTSGSGEGGTLVHVVGAGFTSDSIVTFDGVPALEPHFVSPDLIRVRTPPHAPGTVAVRVTNPDGGVAALSNAFTFQDWRSLCEDDDTTLCLEGGRFAVRVTSPGLPSGRAVPITPKTGAFFLRIAYGLDVVVKILDGRTIDGAYWIHHAGLTESAYTIEVTDRVTGKVARYDHAAGPPASGLDRTTFR